MRNALIWLFFFKKNNAFFKEWVEHDLDKACDENEIRVVKRVLFYQIFDIDYNFFNNPIVSALPTPHLLGTGQGDFLIDQIIIEAINKDCVSLNRLVNFKKIMGDYSLDDQTREALRALFFKDKSITVPFPPLQFPEADSPYGVKQEGALSIGVTLGTDNQPVVSIRRIALSNITGMVYQDFEKNPIYVSREELEKVRMAADPGSLLTPVVYSTAPSPSDWNIFVADAYEKGHVYLADYKKRHQAYTLHPLGRKEKEEEKTGPQTARV